MLPLFLGECDTVAPPFFIAVCLISKKRQMQYFTLQELTRSETAERLNIDNTPNDEQISNLTQLVDHILDPLRTIYGKPVYVSSGYRSVELNTRIGGSKTSQHCKGEAADLIPKDPKDLKRLFRLILTENLPFDQLIFERSTWVHVSMRGGKRPQRGEILTYDGKAYRKIRRDEALELFK